MTDTTNYTISDDASSVPVGVFRTEIGYLECAIDDRHSAVDPIEKARWILRTRKIAAELIGTTCKRAKAYDWDRRERMIEKATSTVSMEIKRLANSVDAMNTLLNYNSCDLAGEIVKLAAMFGTPVARQA